MVVDVDVVAVSVFEFYDYVDIERSVATRPETSHYAIRGLLSVRYLLDWADDDNNFVAEGSYNDTMPGWSYYDNQNGHDIYICADPLAFLEELRNAFENGSNKAA